jgi:predicted DNA-binding protein (MmcQ/YjbR family)
MLASGHLPAMQFDQAQEYLLSLPSAEEGFPFGPEVMVFKVGGKMFATLAYEEVPCRMNLKCDPARSLELRERYASVIPGYHMNKKHWNTITLDDELAPSEVEELITHSYELVVASLPKAQRDLL